MAECRWLKPELVGQFEFVEWTSDNHLRHSRFIALRDDKKPKSVVREKQIVAGKPGEQTANMLTLFRWRFANAK
jgi:ATP-dependent DNA ligase